MQFLDGDGLPWGSGFYAWDRRTGKIYHVAMEDRPFTFFPFFDD